MKNLRLSTLSPDEMALTLTVFELSQSFDWHTEGDLNHLLDSRPANRRYRVSDPSRSRSAASAAA